jgi:hypothetical protein
MSSSKAKAASASASASKPDPKPDTKLYAFVIQHEEIPTPPTDENKGIWIYHSLGAAEKRLQDMREWWTSSTTAISPMRVMNGDEMKGFTVMDEDGLLCHRYWIEKVRLADGCLGSGGSVG